MPAANPHATLRDITPSQRRTAPPEYRPLDETAKLRLSIAARIAAGMCANGENMRMRDWEGQIARSSWDLSGKLLTLAGGGA